MRKIIIFINYCLSGAGLKTTHSSFSGSKHLFAIVGIHIPGLELVGCQENYWPVSARQLELETAMLSRDDSPFMIFYTKGMIPGLDIIHSELCSPYQVSF